MNVLIIGSGRMGIRHALGVISVSKVENVYLADNNIAALENAKSQINNDSNSDKLIYLLTEELQNVYDINIGIIAATASDRIGLCDLAISTGCKTLLIEKPLGQSLNEVKSLIMYLEKREIVAYANFNMRIYPDSIKLKNDLNSLTQFQGKKILTVNTGSVGIGANGIHYLDFLFYLTNTNSFQVINSFINDVTIFSARGSQFEDFGGWIIVKLLLDDVEQATAFISINPESTVFGGWDIVGSHGRITINESSGMRVDYLRNSNSDQPIYRYNADYTNPFISNFDSPQLGDLSKLWLTSLLRKKHILPLLSEAVKAHELLFEWLNTSKKYHSKYPIT